MIVTAPRSPISTILAIENGTHHPTQDDLSLQLMVQGTLSVSLSIAKATYVFDSSSFVALFALLNLYLYLNVGTYN